MAFTRTDDFNKPLEIQQSQSLSFVVSLSSLAVLSLTVLTLHFNQISYLATRSPTS